MRNVYNVMYIAMSFFDEAGILQKRSILCHGRLVPARAAWCRPGPPGAAWARSGPVRGVREDAGQLV